MPALGKGKSGLKKLAPYLLEEKREIMEDCNKNCMQIGWIEKDFTHAELPTLSYSISDFQRIRLIRNSWQLFFV